MTDNCKGCPTFKRCPYTEYSYYCPCIQCLVKVPCDIICKELSGFTTFISDVNRYRDILATAEEFSEEAEKYLSDSN